MRIARFLLTSTVLSSMVLFTACVSEEIDTPDELEPAPLTDDVVAVDVQTPFVTGLLGGIELPPTAKGVMNLRGRDAAEYGEAAMGFINEFAGEYLRAVGDEELEAVAFRQDARGNLGIRFNQRINGLPVVGAQLFVQADATTGIVTRVNGHFVPNRALPVEAEIDADTALSKALVEAEIEANLRTDAELSYVLTREGGAALAWSSTVEYIDELGPQKDVVFADAITGEIAAIHPQHHYARSLRTYSCNNTSCGNLVSSSSNPINTGDNAIDSAHNYAIATYNYYSANHGRDSIDNNGMTMRSRVHYGNNYNNAFWDGSQMTYGDGDGVTFVPLSQDADVVAHELTHGVTSSESNLIYSNESGALNEAWSDIFGALVDRQEGATGNDIWLIGEDIYTPGTAGDALRNMADPKSQGDYDYYPTRYTGSADNGGVHSNSGIANLAFKLLVTGGTHPRGTTSNNVPGIGYDKAADIFYYANTQCLGPSSNFEAARNCTAAGAAALYGATEEAAVHEAWDAVGVPGGSGGGPGCSGTTYSGNLTGTGDVEYEPNGTYYYSGSSGTHSAELDGAGSDFDLYLWKWTGSWTTVASSTSSNSNESISYNGSAGYYVWRVYSSSGSGSYDLCTTRP